MALRSDPWRRTGVLRAAAGEPLAQSRDDVSTARPDARLDALDGIVVLPGAMLARLSSVGSG